MKKLLFVGVLLATLVTTFTEVEAAWFSKKKEKKVKTKTSSTGEVMPEEGAELLVWEAEGAKMEFLMEVAEKFKAKYGIPVEFEPVSDMAAGSKIVQDGPAGTGADVFVINSNMVSDLYQSGIIMPNLLTAKKIQDEYIGIAADAVRMNDGKLYGFPFSVGTHALVYNKDLVPEAPKTMDELLEIGRENTDVFDNRYGFIWSMSSIYTNYGFINAMGGYLFGDNETNAKDLGLANQGTIDGVKEWLKLREISLEDSNDFNPNVMTGLFAEGKVSFTLQGPWAAAKLKKMDFPVGIAEIPTVNGQAFKNFATVQVMAINSYSKYPRAAQLFAKMVTEDAMSLRRFEMTGQLPVSKEVIKNPTIQNDQFAKGFLKQVNNAMVMPAVRELNFIWSPTEAAFSDVWNEKKSVEDAMKHAQKVISEQIDAYQK